MVISYSIRRFQDRPGFVPAPDLLTWVESHSFKTMVSASMPEARTIRLEPNWKTHLEDEFAQPYMAALRAFLLERKQAGAVVYPPGALIFNALDSTPFDEVKVVILGQDPYHGPGQAHGLCFSVRQGVAPPPSLVNIFKEIEDDLGIGRPAGGDLGHWAEQGVLLLNAVLTVERGQAGAHQGKGWERFTDRVVKELNEKRDGLVFLLWGSYALKKGAVIDRQRHLVLSAPHPSPLSAHRGFFGCRHFSKTNRYLQQQDLSPIDWSLS
jgi:uracil-DNA glycosylase